MTLYLTEQHVTDLLSIEEAIQAVEGAFARQAMGEVTLHPRRRMHLPAGTFHTMEAADMGLNVFGIKTYASFSPRTRFVVMLYCAANGNLLAIIEADKLGQIRTGATAGVAAKYLARREADLKVGIYGSGWQAETQLEAICAVRRVASVKVYSRKADKRTAFAQRMTKRLGVDVCACDDPQACAEGQDVIITATNSLQPVLKGAWLMPGTHINAVGGNMLIRRELDDDVVKMADLIVVESIEQCKLESGDFLHPLQKGIFRWEQVVEISNIAAGQHVGRSDSTQITLFKSLGVALEDIATASVVYHKALEQGMGTQLDMWSGH